MSDEQKPTTPTPPPAGAPGRTIPAFLPEEFIPAWQWFEQNGSQVLVTLLLAAIVGGGIAFYLHSRSARADRATEQLSSADSIDALEAAVKQGGDAPAAVAAQLRLAKAYYDGGKYDDALNTYDLFIKKHERHPLVDVALLGRGFALASLNRTGDALEVFRLFQKEMPDHYLIPQAIIGEACCLAASGKKPEAKARLEELRASHRETVWDNAGKRLQGVVDRYEPRAARSLFDMANTLMPAAGAPSIMPAPPPVVSGGTNGQPLIVK